MKTGNLISIIGTLFVLGGSVLKIFHLVNSTSGWIIINIGIVIMVFGLTHENKNLKKRIKELEDR